MSHHQSIAPALRPPTGHRQSMATIPGNGRNIMGPQIAKPLFPSILALFCAVFSCFFTPSPVVPVPGLPPCRPSQTHGLRSLTIRPSAKLTLSQSTPNQPSTPLERDQTLVADSDTTMRPMRPLSALENPSPATTLPPSSHPFPFLFHHSPDTKLPRIRPTFPSWFRYNHAANETNLSYEKLHLSYDCGLISYELAPSTPVFTATKSPPMGPDFVAVSDTTMRPPRPRPVRA